MHLSRAKLSSLNAEQYLETRSRFKLRNPIDWHAAAHFSTRFPRVVGGVSTDMNSCNIQAVRNDSRGHYFRRSKEGAR